jgi:hypothetical protein
MLSGMAKLRPATSSDIERLRARWPQLPEDYFAYMRDVGWGTSPSGRHMIYSGPIAPDEVYPQLSSETNRVLIGDDMQGYCLGYDFATKRYGEYSDFGEWADMEPDFALAAHLNDAG